MGYTGEAIRGMSWLGAFRLFSRALSFFRTLIIARILSPSQFGVYGIVTLVLALIEILTETGINVFLIQKKENVDHYINTAWFVSIVRGFLISAVILLSAEYISSFYQNSELLPLLRLIGIIPFVRGFINPSVVKFQKNLNFNKEFYYRSSIFLVETLVSVSLVIVIKNPSALIYGLLTSAIFEVIISHAIIKPIPNFSFSNQFFREIISNGKWVTSGGILAYLFQNGDNAVIGKMLGTGSLGIYDMAYSISMLPINEISDIVARITFPVYVKISDDRRRLRRAYFRMSILTILLVFPVLMCFLIFPKELILLFLGPKWIQGENIIRIISILAFFSILSSPTGAMFYSVGKQKYLTLLTGISFIVMAVSIVPLINIFGTAGAAISVTISSAIAFPVQIYLLIKVLSE